MNRYHSFIFPIKPFNGCKYIKNPAKKSTLAERQNIIRTYTLKITNTNIEK